MFTPDEWTIFGVVAGGVFLIAIARQFAGSIATEQGEATGLQWLPELERTEQASDPSIGSTDGIDVWLHRIISQADIGLTLPTFLLASGCLSVLAGVGIALAGLSEPIQIFTGVVVFIACVLAVWVRFRQMRRKFAEQFPVALELMSRAVQAGESFPVAVTIARDSTQAPMKTELERCTRQMELGIAPAKAISTLARRIPTIDVKIFAQTIAVHEQMGGRLGTTLQRLSSVIRERGEYIEKLRSATSLGRFAAIMICVIGLCALLYLILCQPEYLARLTQSPLGQRMIIYAVISEVVGIALIFLTLNAEM